MKTAQDYIAEILPKCIDSNCDGNGTIPNQVSDDEWEAQQCQYCFEIRFPLKERLLSSLSQIEKDTEKATREKVIAECIAVVPKTQDVFMGETDERVDEFRQVVLAKLKELK